LDWKLLELDFKSFRKNQSCTLDQSDSIFVLEQNVDDLTIWDALEKTGLKEFVSSLELKLETEITDGTHSIG